MAKRAQGLDWAEPRIKTLSSRATSSTSPDQRRRLIIIPAARNKLDDIWTCLEHCSSYQENTIIAVTLIAFIVRKAHSVYVSHMNNIFSNNDRHQIMFSNDDKHKIISTFKTVWKKWKWKLLSRVRLFATTWTIQSMEFSRPEYWNGYLSQEIFPSQGWNPGLLHCRQILYQLSHQGG